MEMQLARVVVATVLGIAFVVWLGAVRFVARARRSAESVTDGDRLASIENSSPDGLLAGQVVVESNVAGLSGKLARVLSQPQGPALGGIKILHVDDSSVEFAQASSQPNVTFHEGQVRFVSDGAQRALATYVLAPVSGRGLLIAAQVFLVAGIAAIGITAYLMESYVVSSPIPAVRWQCVQSLQVAHFLWPPFMFAARYRALRRQAVDQIETVLANLPHLSQA